MITMLYSIGGEFMKPSFEDSLTCKDLNNFQINNKNVYFKGICQRCLANIEENK